ncbi:MAG: hypothetical protein EA356_03030 [Geminicoccaceae bacterium]|nr:MAG: hypothetical protein EA356_03030 [Geminicoccaceae bacterium]
MTLTRRSGGEHLRLLQAASDGCVWDGPISEAMASAFQRRPWGDVADILQILTARGHARPTPDGRCTA